MFEDFVFTELTTTERFQFGYLARVCISSDECGVCGDGLEKDGGRNSKKGERSERPAASSITVGAAE